MLARFAKMRLAISPQMQGLSPFEAVMNLAQSAVSPQAPARARKSLARRRKSPTPTGISDFGHYGRRLRQTLRRPLVETPGLGSHPGGLRMFSFVPGNLQRAPGLVVVLHGCGQTAAGYDLGAGWSTLAKRYGFALLMPQQQPTNNVNGCFNWFNPEDTTRERGEACSIRQMITRMA